MSYTNRHFTWDFDSLKWFFLNYVLSPLLSLVGYYECATAASQAAKTVTASWYNKIREGGSMKIKFTHKNTAASGVTLKIGSAAAKPLYYEGAPVDATNTWDDGETVEVYFDGTSYYANNVKGVSGDGVFDLSAYNAVNGVLATYADLSAALTAMNALTAKYKKPGMSFKFVQSSDNKYVQARLMAQNFTTDVTQWQGVDDEPTAGSDNLVKSLGVYNELAKRLKRIYDNSDADANIGDIEGNVLLEIKGGHIRLKNFDSRNVLPIYECIEDGFFFVDTQNNIGMTLDVSGNVYARTISKNNITFRTV